MNLKIVSEPNQAMELFRAALMDSTLEEKDKKQLQLFYKNGFIHISATGKIGINRYFLFGIKQYPEPLKTFAKLSHIGALERIFETAKDLIKNYPFSAKQALIKHAQESDLGSSITKKALTLFDLGYLSVSFDGIFLVTKHSNNSDSIMDVTRCSSLSESLKCAKYFRDQELNALLSKKVSAPDVPKTKHNKLITYFTEIKLISINTHTETRQDSFQVNLSWNSLIETEPSEKRQVGTNDQNDALERALIVFARAYIQPMIKRMKPNLNLKALSPNDYQSIEFSFLQRYELLSCLETFNGNDSFIVKKNSYSASDVSTRVQIFSNQQEAHREALMEFSRSILLPKQ